MSVASDRYFSSEHNDCCGIFQDFITSPPPTHNTLIRRYVLALVAHVSAGALQADARVTVVAERLVAVLDEAEVGQLLAAHVTAEAGRVPAGVHRLDDAPDDELVWWGGGGEREQANRRQAGHLRQVTGMRY